MAKSYIFECFLSLEMRKMKSSTRFDISRTTLRTRLYAERVRGRVVCGYSVPDRNKKKEKSLC